MIEKIALFKLLLALAQSAATPQNNKEWECLGTAGLCAKVQEYLTERKDDFWLYGDRPFLQMPGISGVEKISIGSILPMVATGNTTLFTEIQKEAPLYSDAQKALILVTVMSFAQGGKKTDNSAVLTPGYLGKSKTGKPGPSLGYLGYLHSIPKVSSIPDTVWISLMTQEHIDQMSYYSAGLGVPVWEKMPTGEDDDIARVLKESFLGRLVPLSRFVLFSGNMIHYSEGILYPGHKDGAQDITIAVTGGKNPKAIWVDTHKKPWRQLPALLSFFEGDSNDAYECRLLHNVLPRLKRIQKDFMLWSGGLGVSSNAGEQYVSGENDFIESEVRFESEWMDTSWFRRLKNEMEGLDELSRDLSKAIIRYYRMMKAEGKKNAETAIETFWNNCEGIFQELVFSCADGESERLASVRKHIASYSVSCYDMKCPRDTARQLEAWASCRISVRKYITPLGSHTFSKQPH